MNLKYSNRMKIIARVCLFISALTCVQVFAAEQRDGLRKGDLVAVCGDSITEQLRYSVFLGTYLLACKPQEDLGTMSFGRSGEKAEGFLQRIPDVVAVHPTVATVCYGMNDGGYLPLDRNTIDNYRKNATKVIQSLKDNGVRFIALGSPGLVDTDRFPQPPWSLTISTKASEYNETLGELAKTAEQVAKENGVAFADVHTWMEKGMREAKRKYGSNYLVAPDGIHPEASGHFIMAHAFLKALGCNGEIGTITLDMQSGKSQATQGHKILSYAKGRLEIESTRYPYCFKGDPSGSGSPVGMLEFIPFQEELNRYLLVVSHPPAASMKVTWGKTSRTFTADQLKAGVNLAAEFLENPFSEPFDKVQAAVKQQQQFEIDGRWLVEVIACRNEKANPEAGTQAREEAQVAVANFTKEMRENARRAVVPVKHVIQIEPAGSHL